MPLFLIVVVLAAKPHGPVRCADGTTAAPVKAKAQVAALRKELSRRGLHVTDLPSDGQSARREIDKVIVDEQWCQLVAQAQILKSALQRTTLDEHLVSAKVERAKMFAKASRGKQRAKALAQIVKASQTNDKGLVAKANILANAALLSAMGTRDLWQLPKLKSGEPDAPAPKAPVENARSAADLDPDEVTAGCPSVDGATGKGMSSTEATDKLRNLLDTLQVRVVDIKRGPELEHELERQLLARNSAAAVKLACALTRRASQVIDGLDRVTARFQRINTLRDQRGIAPNEKPTFDQLVNEASDQLAKSDFTTARTTLERLLVLLGEPVTPGATVPRP